MPRVDFYILQAGDESARSMFACRIARKAFDQGSRIYLRVQDEGRCAQLDSQLWTFAQNSFVPHCVQNGSEVDWNDYPVQIGLADQPQGPADVLINLSDAVEPGFLEWDRVVEVVSADANGKARGRERFKSYREQGIEPQTHQM